MIKCALVCAWLSKQVNMHSKTALFFVVLYSFVLSVRQGLALQCYNCVKCNDPFDVKQYGDSKIDCSGSCQKLKVNNFVTRNCLPFLKSDDCEEEGDNAACHCTDDLCNSALIAQTPVVLTLFLTASPLLRQNLM